MKQIPIRLDVPAQPPSGVQSKSRRDFIRDSAGMFLFMTACGPFLMSPQEARAQGVAFQVLQPAEVGLLEALGEALLPGAAKAGIAHFVDHQLSVDPADALLAARVVNVRPPFSNFYRAGFAGVGAASQANHGRTFEALDEKEKNQFIDLMRQNKLSGWTGPAAPFFYYVLRNDAVDVVYGTVEGFEKLGVPYMPHILPERKW